ncbi:hypothetical protein ACJIZ3_018140 [Penstemon smallii]|uniref:Uncharacterized protein n=1 Tax=Penstemon smallii TaxID=265156 RepID=A0ABD3SYU6_9LAMI
MHIIKVLRNYPLVVHSLNIIIKIDKFYKLYSFFALILEKL